MYVANPQILMNVLRESVGVISTVPTQCQDTPAPVTLGIRSMKMDMLVMVRTIVHTNILLHTNATYAKRASHELVYIAAESGVIEAVLLYCLWALAHGVTNWPI